MKQYLILHHSDSTMPGNQFAAIDRWHQERGFTKSSLGFFVGYQYVLEKSGQVVQARADQERGCHTVSTMPQYPDLNRDGIGICLAADLTKEQPTEAQLAALSTLVGRLQRQFSIPDGAILLHREVKATSCPGIDLRAIILSRRVTKPDPKVQLDHAEHGLKYATDARRNVLLRLIERLKKLLT